jgi:hypothetical protein
MCRRACDDDYDGDDDDNNKLRGNALDLYSGSALFES